MEQKINVKIIQVKESDYRFLYKLLSERGSKANISHKKMPSFKQHVQFVSQKPYSKWYIIFLNNKKVGSVYLSKQDEIGIFILTKFKNKGIAKEAINLLVKKNHRQRYLANVSPKNKDSKIFFKKRGFKLIQYTYELTTES